MSTTGVASAAVEVPLDPVTAFTVFTADIGTWWKRGTRYWNDAERGQELRFEAEVGGRLIEVHDLDSGEGFEIGRVLVWEPGQRLVFTWRQGDWGDAESTDVEVRFEPVGSGTRVTVEHGGWDRVGSATPDLAEGYGHGWAELLSFYVDYLEAR
ncbi:SRPBCC domain-containing protein [Kribbella monticola]|uniref:SRPBCC domain-containing protein n=1 Tax=Kribbella monticola TaxID=2185285 RepID=UPI000DD30C22|nr:SRPBCC domain-containing protein [Kribbella monticola]